MNSLPEMTYSHLSSGLKVVPLPVGLRGVLDELLLQQLEVIHAVLAGNLRQGGVSKVVRTVVRTVTDMMVFKTVYLVSGDHNLGGVLVPIPGQADVNLVVLHDLPDAPPALPDDHAVDPGVDRDLQLHHRLVLPDDLQDLGLVRENMRARAAWKHKKTRQ